MADEGIQSYDRLREIAPGVHCLDGEWYGSSFRRRMTLMRLANGDLIVHSPILVHEKDFATIEALGRIAYIVAPNAFHESEAHHYKRRYPDAKLFAPRGALKSLTQRCPVDATLPEGWPVKLRPEVQCSEFEGTRILSECVFLHRASKTLVVADLVFNMRKPARRMQRLLYRWNKVSGRFGPSQIFNFVFVKSPGEVAQSVKALLKWDFDRVVMSHGDVLESGGKEALKRGFAEIGIQA